MGLKEMLNVIKKGSSEIISENELINKLKQKKKLRIKFGLDPTAPDIHLGHTVVLHKLRQFQDMGHTIVFIIGDFTARIGDPSGRSETRKSLSKDEVIKNAKTYEKQFSKILDFNKTELVFNSEWFDSMNLSDVLQLSTHSTVAQMLARADFNQRYSNGKDISIVEFLYPLLQGYDSVQIKADVEIGGTDQKFNLLLARELQKDYGQTQQVVITLPLLEGTDGEKKMSKSYNNYIGINESPDEIFGKIMSISDELMMRYYELLTDYNSEDIQAMHPAQAKKQLGETIVERYYSSEQAKNVRERFEKVFKKKELPDDIEEVRVSGDDIRIVDLLFSTGMVSSKNEAKRAIRQSGVKVNGKKINNENYSLTLDKECIIQVGKRRFRKIIPSG